MSISVMRNIAGEIKATEAIRAITTTPAELNSPAYIDRLGYDSALLVINVGAATGSPSSFSVTTNVEDEDVSSAGTLADKGIIISQTAAGITSYAIDLRGYRRYVNIESTVAASGGSSPAVPVSATLILGGAVVNPAA